MNTGTPRFVGSRLLEAREVRGLTQLALSEILGVSAQAISQYEKGQASPQPQVMEKLPAILGVQPSFFVTSRPEPGDTTLFFRSMARATATVRTRAKHKYHWLTDLVDYLGAYVELPAVQMPECHFSADPLAIEDEAVEQAATDLRRQWGLGDGAISNMTHLLENQGFIVSRIPLGAKTLDAFSNWREVEQRPYIVLGTEKDTAVRARLNAGHELAHMVLHRNIEGNVMRNTQAFKAMEAQAFRFAGAFLLPAETFRASFQIRSIAGLTSLKYDWNVSIGAMIMRARHLGLLSEAEEKRLWRNYARRGYRKREPLDDEITPEQPAVLEQALQLLVDERVQSRDQIRAAIPLAPSEIEALAGLPEGFLSSKPQVHLRGTANASRPSEASSAPGSTVIPFPSPPRR